MNLIVVRDAWGVEREVELEGDEVRGTIFCALGEAGSATPMGFTLPLSAVEVVGAVEHAGSVQAAGAVQAAGSPEACRLDQ